VDYLIISNKSNTTISKKINMSLQESKMVQSD